MSASDFPITFCPGLGTDGQRCLAPMHLCGGQDPFTPLYLRSEQAHAPGCDEGENVHGWLHQAGAWELVEQARAGQPIGIEGWWRIRDGYLYKAPVVYVRLSDDGPMPWEQDEAAPAGAWLAWADYMDQVAAGGSLVAPSLPDWLGELIGGHVRPPAMSVPVPTLGTVSGSLLNWPSLARRHKDLTIEWDHPEGDDAACQAAWDLARRNKVRCDLTVTLTTGERGVTAHVDAMAIQAPKDAPIRDRLADQVDALLRPVYRSEGQDVLGSWPFSPAYEWGWA